MVECVVCRKLYPKLESSFAGYGKRRIVPRGWHTAADVKTVRFPVMEKVCAACGGPKVVEKYETPLWRQAKEAWAGVDPTSELGALRGKR